MRHMVVHYNEIALKGGNRTLFENALAVNIRAQLGSRVAHVRRLSGRLLVHLTTDFDTEVAARFGKIFGVASFAPVRIVEPALPAMADTARELVANQGGRTFAIRTKRSFKQFGYTSEEINRTVGETVRQATGRTVNLTEPDTTVRLEVLPREVFVAAETYSGAGGLPVGTAGKVIALLSGGIDSPVAAWRLMKRGCHVDFLHFHSYPHTSRASIEKVRELALIVGQYGMGAQLFLVSFAEAQRQVVMHTEPKFRVLLYRRLMVRIASALAEKLGASALVTGESLGQVASQTLQNMAAIEAVSRVPVFRPLVGDDKEEIIALARTIGTFETSIRPHDDCCSLFVPKNPATRSTHEWLLKEEAKLPIDELVRDTLARAEEEILKPI